MRNKIVFFGVFMAILLFVVLVSVDSKHTSSSSSNSIPKITFPTTPSSSGLSSPSSNINVQPPDVILTSQPPQGQSKQQVTGLSTTGPGSQGNNTQPPIINCPTGEVVSELSQCPSLSLPYGSSGNSSANAQTPPNLGKQVQNWIGSHSSELILQNSTSNSVVLSVTYPSPALFDIAKLQIAFNLHVIGQMTNLGNGALVIVLGRNS